MKTKVRVAVPRPMAGTLQPLPAAAALGQMEMWPAGPWCQRWRGKQHSWRHRSEGGFDRERYWVGPLDEQGAKAFVLEHHYSGSFPASRLLRGS